MVNEKEQSNEATLESREQTGGKRVITSRHEEEIYVDADSLVSFLRDLADQVEQGEELTISTDNWELPFSFDRRQIEVEVDRGYDELEIEIEFDEAKGGGNISVE